MSTLILQFGGPDAPVAIEVINDQLELVDRLTLRGTATLEVAPGSYLVQARLPSGEIIRVQTTVPEAGAQEVTLRPSPSPHEWLEWQHFLGTAPALSADTAARPRPATPIWLRLWSYAGTTWTRVSPGRLTLRHRDEQTALLDLTFVAWQLHALQLGGPTVPWRTTLVPLSDRGVQVLLRPSQVPTERNGGVSLKIVTNDRDTEALSHYLYAGSFTAARVVSDASIQVAEQFSALGAPPTVEQAEVMLLDKIRNPLGAAVAGYYLLRIGALDRLHDWPNNFANWLPWLPDAAIIHAWQLLRQPGSANRSLARRRLLDAAARGIPIYSEGLRLLINGLELLASSRPANGVVTALASVRHLAAAVDWNQRLTTVFGAGPDAPSARPTIGATADSDFALFVSLGEPRTLPPEMPMPPGQLAATPSAPAHLPWFVRAVGQVDREHLPVVEGLTFRLSDGAGPRAHTPIQALVEERLGGGWSVRSRGGGWIDLVPPEHAAPPPLDHTWDTVRALAQLPQVAAVEPLLLVRVPGADADEAAARLGLWGFPYDPETQARLDEASRDHHWPSAQLRLEAAWATWRDRRGAGGARAPGHGVRIAHPDTGYTAHPQIAPILETPGRNFVEPERPDATDDLRTTGPLGFPGHGTGTASDLASPAGDAGPDDDVWGIAPGARVRPLRVSTSVIHLSYRNLVLALEDAIADSAHVVSLSLGSPQSSEALEDVVRRALDTGIIVVAAAGNFLPTVVFPAALRGVIACAASNALGLPWRFSGLGAEVAVTAPGERVWHANATLADGRIAFGASAGDGTSHAAAAVAGLAALWLSFHGRDELLARYGAPLLPYAFQLHLRQSADASPGFIDGGRGGFGAGIASAPGLLDEPPTRADVEAFVAQLAGGGDNSFEWALHQLGRIIRAPGREHGVAPPAGLAPATAAEGARGLVRELLGPAADAALMRELTALIAAKPLLHRAALGASGASGGAAAPPGGPPARALVVLRQRLLQLPLSAALRQSLAAARAERRASQVPARPIAEVRSRYIPAPPTVRRLRAYAFDPSLATRLDTVAVNAVTIPVAFEPRLEAGPVGDYLAVVDVDPATGCAYAPVDLNAPALLAQDGLPRSEGNPQFHQQMVYAVAMKTIEHFQQALGRPVFWSPLRPWRGGDDAASGGDDDAPDQFVRRLRLYPHALREANAYYSPTKRAILFGYFPAGSSDPAEQYPEGLVFTCLSHDIIAHEMTHAILDGMHAYFTEPTNPDVFAFHEAFADIVALFQHFTYPELLRSQIARARGDLTSENLLGQLAREFGLATGAHQALRDAIGGVVVPEGEAGGAAAMVAQAAERRAARATPAGADVGPAPPARPVWMRYQPTPFLLPAVEEAHARGAILVAAVFDAFLAIYRRRVADLARIATGGTGVLPDGQLHPDLVNRMADEAAKAAGHVLRMCIRAMDYVPPVDITFGEFLRALITADYDLVPDDQLLYRVAFIEAFRRWGIYPRDVRTLSEESLRWHSPDELSLFPPRGRDGSARNDDGDDDGDGQSPFVLKMQRLLRRAVLEWQPGADREATFRHLSTAQRMLNGYLQHAARHWPGPDWARRLLPGIDPGQGISVANLRPARRIGPDGQFLTEFVFEVMQPARDAPGGASPLRGGVTVIVGLDDWRVRYAIYKRRYDEAGALNANRRERQLAYARQRAATLGAAAGAAEYSCPGELPPGLDRAVNREAMRADSCACRARRQGGGAQAAALEPFALLHRGGR